LENITKLLKSRSTECTIQKCEKIKTQSVNSTTAYFRVRSRRLQNWLLKTDSMPIIPGFMFETTTPAGSHARAVNGLSLIGSSKYCMSIKYSPADQPTTSYLPAIYALNTIFSIAMLVCLFTVYLFIRWSD